MTSRASTAKHVAATDRGLRRRLLTLSLDLSPGDLREAAYVHPVKVSQVLGGVACFAPTEAASIARVAGRRLRQLLTE